MIRIIFKLLVTVICFIFYVLTMFILFLTTSWGFKKWTCEWIMGFLEFWNINIDDVTVYKKRK